MLRQGLEAVLASLRLKGQELWRLNASGALPRPGFWPRSLASWYWPLVLLVSLALSSAVVGLALGGRPSPPAAAREEPQAGLASSPPGASDPAGIGLAGASVNGANDGGIPGPVTGDQLPPTDHAAELPGARQPASQRQPQADSPGPEPVASLWGLDPEALASGPAPIQPPPGFSGPSPAQGEPPDVAVPTPRGAAVGDALKGQLSLGSQARFSPPDGADQADQAEEAALVANPVGTLLGLLRATTPEAPPLSVGFGDDPTALELRTSADFERAPSAARQDWADRWLELVRERGFSQLTLLDPAGRLLGRQARAGSGMILLQPFSAPP